ncbi:MAG: SDR family NAD(P)-dependent oxidoreductase [Chthoniobacterales bacterium]
MKQPESTKKSRRDDIAIVGIGIRFPGGLNDVESFWKFLLEGRDAVTEIPADRWSIERYYDPEPGIPGKTIAKWGGFIDGIDRFDPQFFGISPREAPYIDPQQRLLLETAWEAIEDAGMVLDLERGTNIGVYAGVSHTDYQHIQGGAADKHGISPHSPTGNAHSIAANRISYCLNLTGPSIAMDTACSSALTALHVACEQLRAGRCAAALAGGVTVMITPDGFIGFSQASMLSPDGRCRAFDASANGFVRGEGAGMVLLKPLSKALADGDHIYAVVRGTSANQDGHTNGIMLPGEEAQTRLVRDACTDAGVDPTEIGYVEAHGTGTAVGDPIEAHALSRALCENRATDQPLPIGSVKSNLGHLETAAGIAGLVKAALVVSRGQIPPSLHFEKPSPHIDFSACKLRVPVVTEDFGMDGDKPRLAGVNSFGFGGANAHAILSSPPAHPSAGKVEKNTSRTWPVVLSARSEESLRESASRLAAWLEAHASGNGTSPLVPDLVYTLGARRNHHPYRLTLSARTTAEVVAELRAHGTGEPMLSGRSTFTPRPEKAPRIGFIMSGQGPQWWGMGRELMKAEPVFRQTIEECAAAMQPHADFSLLEELSRDEADSQLHHTKIGQPAIFAMQAGLTRLWRSWGVEPCAVTGHSVGEIAAAWAAGILTLEEAAKVVVIRAREMQDCARGEGKMLAVGLSATEAGELIARHDPEVTVSAFNGPKSLTLSGRPASLEPMAAELEAAGVFARFVRVNHPFHHAMMQPAADAMERVLADVRPRMEAVPFFSTVTGERCSGAECTAGYWARGIRQPVRFADSVGAMQAHGVDIWLEIGAHPALVVSLQECLGALGAKAPSVASARREREQESLVEAALELHRLGVDLDFAAMTPSRRLLALPAYPWNKERWWHESPEMRDSRLVPGGKGLLGVRLPRAIPTWMAHLDERHLAYLRDHRVDSRIVFPAAGFIEMALEAGQEMFEGRPFVIEEFEIRKPLIIPESPENLILELTYDPAERGFSIQSRLDAASSWSLHAVGSLRSERVESSFEASRWTPPANDLDPIDVDENYEHKRSRGLPYGPEFRVARDVHARDGHSCGLVELSEKAAKRAGEYALHPVILDASLHVFSAGARTVEDRNVKLKLPVRFSRILFLRSPGSAARVRAEVLHCNEEMTEGRIALYDREGDPCVLVDGFRAIALSSVRRAGSSTGDGRDLVYHVDWERAEPSRVVAPSAPALLGDLHRAAAAALDAVLLSRGKKRLQTVMGEEDDLAAAQIADGLRRMGVSCGAKFTAASLAVAPPMTSIFRRFAENLSGREALHADGDGWRALPSFDALADSAPEVLRKFLTRFPGHLQEALLCVATCAELPGILRGEKDAVQVLFAGAGTDWLEHFYGDGLFAGHWMAAIGAAVEKAAEQCEEGRGLRILEAGAGTGGLASYVLPLLERGLHRYVFSDESTAFFPPAQQKLAAYPEVEYRVFDLDKAAMAQGFEPESFDFIVGTNVLHAAADIRECLAKLHDLLAPGGTLAFMDVASARIWTESIFGVTSGWWNLTDRDLRPEHPLLPRERWEELLRDTGFIETKSLAGLHGAKSGEGQVGVLARKAGHQLESLAVDPAALDDKAWIIFASPKGEGADLAALLRAAGADVCLVSRADGFRIADNGDAVIRPGSVEDWTKLGASWASGVMPDRFVYFWSGDAAESDDVLVATSELLHFSHALDLLPPGVKVRVDMVTRGAQAVGRDCRPVSIAQGACLGLFRVILSEHPNFSFCAIDLPSRAGAHDLDFLLDELLRKDVEREVALRGGARYVQRFARGLEREESTFDPAVPLRLQSRERGVIDSLKLTAFPMPQCGSGEVLIKVAAAGLNFRDVLKALGLYPAETADARMYGDEVAGEIVAVGEGVSHVKPGDRVFGLAVFGLATYTLARAADILPLPDDITFEEAATIPVVFMTAWHALKNVAHLRSGETVLVHAGAGGVGMAAIQIARYTGAKVIASAGSPAKRALLSTMGVDHVIDSRRGDFAERVMELTGRKGVDVVINALAAEAIPMGLACLGEFGRFIEIGKRDIYQNSKLPMWHLRRNASFHVVAMDAVFAGDEALTRELMAEITGLVAKGSLGPLPYRSFPANRADAAFRLMAAGKHTGKVLLNMAAPFLPKKGKPLHRPFTVDSGASYMVTGGFGGFGKVIARWLVARGARHLVLTSRKGLETAGAKEFIAEMAQEGAEIVAVSADVGSHTDVEKLFEEIRATGRPLKGVFHLAMVIDDAPLANLTPERFRSVLTPKALGGWLLHEQTKSMPLDAFVMFSSASSIFGNPGQGNYSAANALLDSLAHHRRALGLPGLAVNWGVLGGEGYVARNEKVAEFLARQGTEALAPAEVTALLETFLDAGVAQMAALRVDWTKWRQSFRGLQENPLLERVFASGIESEEALGKSSDWRARIEAVAPAEREAMVVQALQEIVGSVLRVKPESLRPDQPLTDLGLDSLMGVEIENLIESSVGVALPPASLMRARTIGQIASMLSGHLGAPATANPSARASAAPAEENISVAEVDLDALSGEDINRLLGALSSADGATPSPAPLS